MRWIETQPAFCPVIAYDVAQILSMEDDVPEWLGDVIAAATAYAETAMGRSLMRRTVTATFYANLCPPDELYLPRGPIISITPA